MTRVMTIGLTTGVLLIDVSHTLDSGHVSQVILIMRNVLRNWTFFGCNTPNYAVSYF